MAAGVAFAVVDGLVVGALVADGLVATVAFVVTFTAGLTVALTVCFVVTSATGLAVAFIVAFAAGLAVVTLASGLTDNFLTIFNIGFNAATNLSTNL